jgi:hypothetical protein
MAFQALIEDPISNSFPGMVTKKYIGFQVEFLLPSKGYIQIWM